MGFRAGFPRARAAEREYLVRICDFGSKRIGLDRVFMKVWLGVQTQESEPKNPSPGLAIEESKRRNSRLSMK